MTVSLADLAHKVAGGRLLSDDDARQLMATTDLVTVGMVAAEARRVHGGDRVTFVRVAEIACGAPVPGGGEPDAGASGSGAPGSGASGRGTSSGGTSSGGASSGAVSGGAVPGSGAPGTGTQRIGSADRGGGDAGWPAAARELRVTGAPASVEEALASVRAVVASAGGRVVTGFSLADLWTLAGGATGLQDLARALVDAGLSAVAEVPVDRLSPSDARDVLGAVAAAGLAAPVARWDAVPQDPVAALRVLRELQEQTRAFRAFAPLPRATQSDAPQTGYDGVKLVALARVMLDNVPAIQVNWAHHGPKLAQVALLFGASDLDGVSPSDDSPLGHRRAPLEEVQRNIKAAFLQPIERDGKFELVSR